MKGKLSNVEGIKVSSDNLRGTLKEDLQSPYRGCVNADNSQVIKFHGIYLQDDRDRRLIRKNKKLSRDYSFLLRLRIVGGRVTAKQMLGIIKTADLYSKGSIKITSRQCIQLHHIEKFSLKAAVQSVNSYGIDSRSTSGDVNRSVILTSNYLDTKINDELLSFARDLSLKLLPKTNAYNDVWLDDNIRKDEEDRIYGKDYLPRKFKIGIAIPPFNDVDVFVQDLGLIAIIVSGELVGFNVAIGGGMGSKHGNEDSYMRLASMIGYVDKAKVFDIIYAIVDFYRQTGNREDRKLARLKYVLDNKGLDFCVRSIEAMSNIKLEEAREYEFSHRDDIYSWHRHTDGRWHCSIFLENGVLRDSEHYKVRSAIERIANLGITEFQFTTNQNIAVYGCYEKDKVSIEKILDSCGISTSNLSPIRKNALACVALNTCPVALAEGQRYLPILISKIEDNILSKYGLLDENISIRMTGCPNGCVRTYVADIGLVGVRPGIYNLHIGGSPLGERLGILYKKELDEEGILENLDTLFSKYASGKRDFKDFSDFLSSYCSSLSSL